jgi:hypothetical protein
MTFHEAEKELKKLARGNYHTITYRLVTHIDGTQEAECSIYIEKEEIISKPTWKQALAKMKENICPIRFIDNHEAP